ncbi:HNH endonuclease signature motif containing protein [Pseudomonas paraeruginosa]|uniref:HNH endonuclease signature motif containing protein n=1 Tax=Pseudomonas paraeruginosa TaxID=2994495 RepID=UPI0039FD4F00
MPDGIIDHIDGNTLNNRISNLRIVDRKENARNMSRSRSNTSGLMGVYWRKDLEVWRATIRPGKFVSLPSDGTLFDAVCARKSAEIYYGFHENHGRHRSQPYSTPDPSP